MIGNVGVGGKNPIRIQSMTTTDTMDVDATVKQSITLAEAGCEIIRITAPTTKAAAALGEIRRQLSKAGIDVPLVADIHFTPKAAMEAANHVEKIRINPGNYADRKKFKVREYTDDQYEQELDRLAAAFSPIVKKCRELGRAMRIGTNHGSLSDRIMNRYGDTPHGMVESAMEFIRICESHSFKDIILSMKASNPKVMIEAYRLTVARMKEEGMNYPLHLGVTEAGDGEDARIKSTIGIGSLLYDGLGDTIRVSLTEDPEFEIPVARELARRAMALWTRNPEGEILYAGTHDNGDSKAYPWQDSIDPFHFKANPANTLEIQEKFNLGEKDPPAVFVPAGKSIHQFRELIQDVARAHSRLRDAKIEGLILECPGSGSPEPLRKIREALGLSIRSFILNLGASPDLAWLDELRPSDKSLGTLILHLEPRSLENIPWDPLIRLAGEKRALIALTLPKTTLDDALIRILKENGDRFILSLNPVPPCEAHPLGQFRELAENLRKEQLAPPLWIRITEKTGILDLVDGRDRLLEASLYAGPILCDGMGNCISLETEPDLTRATSLAYNILQGAKARISRTEFVACPSCGRTLFDLQSTTRKIRDRTDHLKGVTIAVMGCIVNGPGEMADADFGYVGGAPGKVTLYVRKNPVLYNVPENEAVDRLIDLIKKEGKWTDPPQYREDAADHEKNAASASA